jgi:hypothetical protein
MIRVRNIHAIERQMLVIRTHLARQGHRPEGEHPGAQVSMNPILCVAPVIPV